VETAVLSTTAKVKARTDRKKKDGADADMSASEVSIKKQESDVKKDGEDEKMEVDEEAKKKEEEEKKPEPTEAILKNPSRVVK